MAYGEVFGDANATEITNFSLKFATCYRREQTGKDGNREGQDQAWKCWWWIQNMCTTNGEHMW